jgi:succinate dehydrogenase / fumarate reductase cytochrome b subunit
MRYRVKPGFAAWVLMRVSGLLLTLYLVLHVWVLSHLSQGPEAFDGLIRRLESPLVRGLEGLLAAALLFHAANGLRLILVDFFAEGALYQRPLFWLASAAAGAGLVGLACWGLWAGGL